MAHMNIFQVKKSDDKEVECLRPETGKELALLVEKYQVFARTIKVLQNELGSLSELRETLEKSIGAPLNCQAQTVSLMKTEMSTVELRINEKMAIATQLHKQFKSNLSLLEVKESKIASLTAQLDKLRKSKTDMGIRLKQLEDINRTNKSLALAQKEKCDFLTQENNELQMKINQLLKGGHPLLDRYDYGDQVNRDSNEAAELTDQIEQMTSMINQLESKKSRIYTQMKEDMAQVKERKIEFLEDKLQRKKEKERRLIQEQRDLEMHLKEMKEILKAYSNQAKQIETQLKSFEQNDQIIKKHLIRREALFSSLIPAITSTTTQDSQ